MEETEEKKFIIFLKDWYFLILLIIAIFVAYIIVDYYISRFDECLIFGGPDTFGVFGDFIGGILNPTLAFFSLIALLITIRIQSKELKNSTEELAKSSEALTEQSKSLQLQNFENTFFNMISLHNEIIKNISLEVKEKHPNFDFDGRETYYYSILDKKVALIEDKPYYGKNIFPILFKILDTYIKDNIETKDIFILYNNFHHEYDDIISHYFRNVYQILKFINKQEILKDINKNKELENQKFYTNILRAQFSSIEFAFLFMNSLYKSDNKLFPLLVKFEFLEPLNIIVKYTNNSKPNETIFKSPYLDKSYAFEAINKCIKDTTDIENENYPKNKIFGSNYYMKIYIKHFNTSSQEQQ